MATLAPHSRSGHWSFGLLALAAVLFAIFTTVVVPALGGGGETFFSRPLHAATILAAGASAVGAGAAATWALIHRDRAVVLAIPLLVGLFVLFFSIGELVSPH